MNLHEKLVQEFSFNMQLNWNLSLNWDNFIVQGTKNLKYVVKNLESKSLFLQLNEKWKYWKMIFYPHSQFLVVSKGKIMICSWRYSRSLYENERIFFKWEKKLNKYKKIRFLKFYLISSLISMKIRNNELLKWS